jgi:hypothetical protein
MKKYGFVTVLIIFLLSQIGCEKDYLVPKVVEVNFPVSFSHDVLPIFSDDCAIPTCHISGGVPPNLTTDKAYDELMGLGYVDTTNVDQSILYVRLTSTTKPMPPTGKLPAEEIAYIHAWIQQGALNN